MGTTKRRIQGSIESSNMRKNIGKKIKPLFEGYISNFTVDKILQKSAVFFGTKNDPDDLIVVDYNPHFDDKACKVCLALRKKYGIDLCRQSDTNAVKAVIAHYNEGTELDSKYKKESYALSENLIEYYIYNCDPIGMTEWIIPVFVDAAKGKTCVGLFITGQFFTDYDDEIKAANILESYNSIGLTCEEIVEALKKAEPLNDARKKILFEKILEAQEELQISYNNTFIRCEQTIYNGLRKMILGMNSPYIGVEDLESSELNDIFSRFRLARTYLLDAVIALGNIFDLKEVAVFKARSDGVEFDGSENTPGAILTGEREKAPGDDLSYDRSFYESFLCLNVEKIKNEMKNEDGQYVNITQKDEGCIDYLAVNSVYLENVKSKLTEAKRASLNCRFMNEQKGICSFVDDEKKGIIRPPCSESDKTEGCCPFLLNAWLPLDVAKDRFKNCLLLVYTAKGHPGHPVGFLVVFDENEESRKSGIVNSLKKFFELLSTAFLAQWNMLVAQFRQMIFYGNNGYTRHELNNVLMGMIALNNKLVSKHNKVIRPDVRNVLKSFPDLPDSVIDLLEYLPYQISDTESFLGILQNISDNTAALTEDLVLHLDEFYLQSRVFNTLQAAYRYFDDKNTRRLICPYLYAGEINPKITADANKLMQAIDNLIKNAYKYSYECTNIRIVRAFSDDKKKLYISVISYGGDIPEEKRDKIFEMGYRGEENPIQDGQGLGLFIARKFVKKHGGALVLETPELLSDLNIPLIRDYPSVRDKHIQMDSGTIEKCNEAYKTLSTNGIYNEVTNIDRNISRARAPITPFEYKDFINNPTYRIKFTLWIPVEGVQ